MDGYETPFTCIAEALRLLYEFSIRVLGITILLLDLHMHPVEDVLAILLCGSFHCFTMSLYVLPRHLVNMIVTYSSSAFYWHSNDKIVTLHTAH